MSPKTLPPVLRIAPQTARVDLDGPYTGGWVEVLLNPPTWAMDVFQHEGHAYAEAQAADAAASYYPGPDYRRAVAALLRAWNLVDEAGTPLPPTVASLDLLDWSISHAIVQAWGRAAALPKVNGTT